MTLHFSDGWRSPPVEWLSPWPVILAVVAWYVLRHIALFGGFRGAVLAWSGYRDAQTNMPLTFDQSEKWRTDVVRHVRAAGYRIEQQLLRDNRQLLLLHHPDNGWQVSCLTHLVNQDRYQVRPQLFRNQPGARERFETLKPWLETGQD